MACLIGCSSKPPSKRGIVDGSLLPCPATPNCVSTMDRGNENAVSSLRYTGTRDEAREVLKHAIIQLGRTKLKEELDNYLWVECRTKFFGFTDDLEIYLPENDKIVHLRSASRLGYSDLGANKRRIKRVQDLFTQLQKSS